MSLRDAIETIIEDMETNPLWASAMVSYAKMLKIALKSSEGEVASPVYASPTQQMPSEAHHRIMIEKAKAEFANKKLDLEENLSVKMVELVDGPGYDKSSPTYVDIPNEVKPGMKTVINGSVYQLHRDNTLHYLTPAEADSLVSTH